MTEIREALLAWYLADPQWALATLGLTSVVLLMVCLLLLLRLQRVRGELRSVQSTLAANQDALLQQLEQGRQQSSDSMYHGLQALQVVLSDKVATLERELFRDAAARKQELLAAFAQQARTVAEALAEARLAQQGENAELRRTTGQALGEHRELSERIQREAIGKQQQTLVTTLTGMGQQVQEGFRESSEQLGKRVELLTRTTDERLKEISGQVEKRLSEGFEKTTETFTRVLEHLTRIDEAQKKITELSGNVVSLQEVLTDKRSRGAFGEVQLGALVRNLMPEGSYQEQASLSNGRRVDFLLRMPDPTGDVPIDAKFPLESYQRMLDGELAEAQRKAAATQFRRDIRKHISDIAERYLVPGETSDGAVMFIPAEAVFAEIHAHFPDLVEQAQRARVWMVSPTTLMAVLTTARSVLKDDATRKQVHVIQEHLRLLAADFNRFRQRMDKLATHIRQAKDDVDQVHTSASKISSRFRHIEQVELPGSDPDG